MRPASWLPDIVRVVETVLLENGRFCLCRKQCGFDGAGGNDDFVFHPQENNGLAPQTPEIDEKRRKRRVSLTQMHRLSKALFVKSQALIKG